MAQIAPITLKDGQATPVNHTFNPVGIKDNIATWADRSGGVSLGYPVVTLSLREPNKGSRAYKMTAKVVLPILEVTSPSTATGIQPAPTLAFNLVADLNMVLPERSTLAQRKDLAAYLTDFIASTVVKAMVESQESVY